MTVISKCPNCKKEDTMCYDATWGVCAACGWRGNPSSFGYVPKTQTEPELVNEVKKLMTNRAKYKKREVVEEDETTSDE